MSINKELTDAFFNVSSNLTEKITKEIPNFNNYNNFNYTKFILIKNSEKLKEKVFKYLNLIENKEKVKEFISSYPYFFSILCNGLEKDFEVLYVDDMFYASQYSFFNYIDSSFETEIELNFIISGIDLFIKNNVIENYENLIDDNGDFDCFLLDKYNDNIGTLVENEMDQLKSEGLIVSIYNEDDMDSIRYIIQFPLLEIIRYSITDKEIYDYMKNLMKIKSMEFKLGNK